MGYTESFMIYIAHRGLFKGPDKTLENHPGQIMYALEQGYNCEVDIRLVDNKLYLGHDEPQYEIDEYWLRDSNLWIHCKNKEAIDWFYKCNYWSYNYFWHEDDHYTLTSKGYIWTHPKAQLLSKSIMVMPEHFDDTLNNTMNAKCFAICSDYVELIKSKRNDL